MNNRNRKTLTAVFATPVRGTMPFREIEVLLIAVGCKRSERSGSAVIFEKDGFSVSFHRPHPGKEAKPYRVRLAREFLGRLGIEP